MELLEDDLAVEIADEYDPMIPNSYELILNQRKEIEARKELEVGTPSGFVNLGRIAWRYSINYPSLPKSKVL